MSTATSIAVSIVHSIARGIEGAIGATTPTPPPTGDWLLITGFWVDTDVWLDTGVWID